VANARWGVSYCANREGRPGALHNYVSVGPIRGDGDTYTPVNIESPDETYYAMVTLVPAVGEFAVNVEAGVSGLMGANNI
jgi:hypothetical protein